MNKVNERKQNSIIIKNSVFSIGFKGLSYILSFLTTPLLLNCLGEVKYGIYTTALSLVSWIYYFDFGIGSGLRNKVTKALIDEDRETVQKSVNAAYFIISLISLLAFTLVLIASFFLDFDEILHAGLTDESLNVILLVAILFACINFVLSLSKNILWAIQLTAFVDGLSIVSKVFWLAALWIYSKTGSASMLIIVLLEGISELIRNMIASVYITRKSIGIRPTFGKIDMTYSKGILGFGLQIFVMQIAALVLNTTDNMIIMRLFTASDVTPYSLGHKYFSFINAFFIAATGSLWTTYTTAYTVKDAAYIKKTLRKALAFYCITLLGIVIAYIVYVPFMRIYLGVELEYQSGLIFLIALYYAILIFSHNFSAFVHGISKVKLTTIACVISAIVNVPCSIFLAATCAMGLNGVILGSIVSLLITTPCYLYTTVKEIKKMEESR